MASATDAKIVHFGSFVLDETNARLLRCAEKSGEKECRVDLTPKAFEMLCYLVSHADQLVTKEDLLSALWPDVIVGDASVKVAIREIRRALGDDATAPRYIETEHRRGYRFIAPVQRVMRDSAAAPGDAPRPAAAPPAACAPPADLPGRAEELRLLCGRFERALHGERQCVFVTGGAGTGKTALVQTLLATLESNGDARKRPLVLTGHCFEQFGKAEPYMPVWEALGRLARSHATPSVDDLLKRYAHGSGEGDRSLVASAERASPGPGGQSDRLLRELADAIEGLTADLPVILLLEDLHWADHSTLDLVTALVRRRSSSARLMILCTNRPPDPDAADHPLGAMLGALLSGALCVEVALRPLDEFAVEQYVKARLPDVGPLPWELTERLHRRTGGHPLFLAHLIDDLQEQGLLPAAGISEAEARRRMEALEQRVPRTARVMIEMQLGRLDPAARQVLEAAAVVGVEFTSAAVSAALDGSVGEREIDSLCDAFARRHRFIEPAGLGRWPGAPDDSFLAAYRFVHELYHNVVYQQIHPATRMRLHHALAKRLDAAYSGRDAAGADGVAAAELAVHFERAQDWPSAMRFLRRAANAALRQYAHREAVQYLRRALAAFDWLPPEQRGPRDELDMLMALAVNLQVTCGCAYPEVAQLHNRAHAICQKLGASGADLRESFPVLWGIWVFHKVRSNLEQAQAMARQLLAIATEADDPALLLPAYQAMCVTALCCGEPELARQQLEDARRRYDPALHADDAGRFGQDPGVATLAFGAVACQLLGDEDEAVATSRQATETARAGGHPYTIAFAGHFAAMLHQLRGDPGECARWARQTIALSEAEGFAFWRAGCTVIGGWAEAMQAEDEAEQERAIEQIRLGIEWWDATGSRTYHTYHLGLLAEALLHAGRKREAEEVVVEALGAVESLGEKLYAGRLKRLEKLTRSAAVKR
jgi:DNA-binding winged helix-turn-helix (wHTH) protein/tetratricopeptide (TPR) repeat protein